MFYLDRKTYIILTLAHTFPHIELLNFQKHRKWIMLYLFRGAVVNSSKTLKDQQNTMAPETLLARCETMTADTERQNMSKSIAVQPLKKFKWQIKWALNLLRIPSSHTSVLEAQNEVWTDSMRWHVSQRTADFPNSHSIYFLKETVRRGWIIMRIIIYT